MSGNFEDYFTSLDQTFAIIAKQQSQIAELCETIKLKFIVPGVQDPDAGVQNPDAVTAQPVAVTGIVNGSTV